MPRACREVKIKIVEKAAYHLEEEIDPVLV